MIRSAGTLLWREKQDRTVEVALIYRPKYQDWSLPKGKIEAGETTLQCAYRELIEETGIRAKFTRHIGTAMYEEGGEKKQVVFWAAHCALDKSTFIPNEEVTELVWLAPEKAKEKASHKSDKKIITSFEEVERYTDTLIILRHVKALERGDWDGSDSLRTLSEVGFEQSQLLIKHLEAFAIDEIYTSDYVRCVQTVTPLAQARELSVMEVPNLNEENFENDPLRAISFANAVKQDEKNILICSHNPVIPTMLRGILNSSWRNKDLIKLEPGDAWVVHRVKGEVVALDYISVKI